MIVKNSPFHFVNEFDARKEAIHASMPLNSTTRNRASHNAKDKRNVNKKVYLLKNLKTQQFFVAVRKVRGYLELATFVGGRQVA